MNAERSAASRWLTYLRERSPVALLLIVAAAQSISASYLVSGDFALRGTMASTIGIAALLVLMRLMDEVKDFEKDRLAHPNRPLPRGLVSIREARRAVVILGIVLVAYAAVTVGTMRSPVPGVLYLLTLAYAFLMYREFFVPRLIGVNAFIYAVTHQVIVIPIYLFAVACAAPEQALGPRAVWFALTGLGASFVLEVSRKLDPAAHPALGTYLRLYGPAAAGIAIVAGLGLLALAAYRIDVHPIVWPFVAVVLVLLPLLRVRPARFRLIEGASALLGLVQMLAPALRHAWRAFA